MLLLLTTGLFKCGLGNEELSFGLLPFGLVPSLEIWSDDMILVPQDEKVKGEMTEAQIKALLLSYLKQSLEEDQRNRAPGRKRWQEGEDLDDQVDALSYLQHDCNRELAIGNYSRVTGAVERLLVEKSIKLDRDGVSYKILCRQMMKVMINRLEIEMRRSRLDYSLDDLPFPEILGK